MISNWNDISLRHIYFWLFLYDNDLYVRAVKITRNMSNSIRGDAYMDTMFFVLGIGTAASVTATDKSKSAVLPKYVFLLFDVILIPRLN